MQKYANDVETSLQLLQAVSMLCFRFISKCVTAFRPLLGHVPAVWTPIS